MPAKSPCRSHSFVVQHSLPRGLDSLRLSICRILYELSSPALGTIFHISRLFYSGHISSLLLWRRTCTPLALS
eukprot:g19839.t1